MKRSKYRLGEEVLDIMSHQKAWVVGIKFLKPQSREGFKYQLFHVGADAPQPFFTPEEDISSLYME